MLFAGAWCCRRRATCACAAFAGGKCMGSGASADGADRGRVCVAGDGGGARGAEEADPGPVL